jgi:hypothetical protein
MQIYAKNSRFFLNEKKKYHIPEPETIGGSRCYEVRWLACMCGWQTTISLFSLGSKKSNTSGDQGDELGKVSPMIF